MRALFQGRKFKTDLKRVARSGRYKVADLLQVVEALRQGRPLSPRHRDHALVGEWGECRECHIRPDWLLVYRLEQDTLVLIRTGSHADLFE